MRVHGAIVHARLCVACLFLASMNLPGATVCKPIRKNEIRPMKIERTCPCFGGGGETFSSVWNADLRSGKRRRLRLWFRGGGVCTPNTAKRGISDCVERADRRSAFQTGLEAYPPHTRIGLDAGAVEAEATRRTQRLHREQREGVCLKSKPEERRSRLSGARTSGLGSGGG